MVKESHGTLRQGLSRQILFHINNTNAVIVKIINVRKPLKLLDYFRFVLKLL